jgi:hypothetical protein
MAPPRICGPGAPYDAHPRHNRNAAPHTIKTTAVHPRRFWASYSPVSTWNLTCVNFIFACYFCVSLTPPGSRWTWNRHRFSRCCSVGSVMLRGCPSQDIHAWRGILDTTVEEPEADLGPNGRTTSRMHCSRREWTGDRPDYGRKTTLYTWR